MNRCQLVGRLTRDPESSVSRNGVAITRFGIATEGWKDGASSPDFHSCTAWGKTAEFVAKYFGKGKTISVAGSVKYSEWEGKRRTTIEISHASFVPGSNGGGRNESSTKGDDVPF